ncbi:ketopantoate reductase family protein [Reinekea blandensis]|uniref:2-dehydropantoate 2-reductase n=1 Tax=Reinekea blandensis MED297 TaxID=314283 RepID=A4BER2_9GAMM|nr:2-dehydropantoate 2-reductase [Reinekea blandensis]EAR09489.1 2-dehydropantoate 2-reductase [Reinekea sp. MED297] [Reinekea blandensis MED297]
MSDFSSLIIGPGAIGSLVCAEIQPFSRVSVFAHRQNLTLATHLDLPGKTLALDWTVTPAPSVDVIWVCCKAMHAEQSTQQALARYSNATVVLLHNGMGPQQALSEAFGDQIIWGSTTCGALPISPQHYVQTSFGHTLMDQRAAHERPDYFNALIARSDQSNILKPAAIESIEAVLWQKILVNACINPLTAYHSVKNGQLSTNDHQREICAILNEITKLIQAKHLTLSEDPLTMVNQVITNSAENWSSMARDVQEGRKTEIDFINGFLIREGARLGIKTPVLERWYKRIAQRQVS